MNNENPITKVYLLSVPLESDYKNTFYFANASAQQTYFQSKVVASYNYSDFTYQRKDHIIRIPTIYDNIYNCNYVMYQNSKYSNKWFYAFITKMEYINDGRTDIHIETDVIQTWLFDYTLKASFVEREHTNNDSVGSNTVPENLETGSYISCKLQPTQGFSLTSSDCCFVIAVSELILGLSYATFQSIIPMGLYYIGCTTQGGIRDFVKAYDEAGKGEAINSIFVAPKSFFGSWRTITYDGDTFDGQFSLTMTYETTHTVEVTKVNYLGNDYVPRNNKLLTYPYTFLQVSNNSGSIVNYNWENFNLLSIADEGRIEFHVIGTITPGCSYRAYPINYNNILNDLDDGINLGKLPIGSWTSDVYTNWLTQNGVNIAGITLNAEQKGIVGGALMTGLGLGQLLGGNMFGAGTMASGLGQIANAVQENYRHSLIPDQTGGNVNCGDVNYQFEITGLHFKRMSIKNEYARIIDGYFDMFGYKTNTVKVPNSNHRARWWYTKTIDVNIDGNIDNNDMQKIKSCYNNGITFWRNPSEIQNYSLSNPIV